MSTKFKWLHLTDLHVGLDAQHRWPRVESLFLDDLQKDVDQSGTWDVVFFSGDLTQHGKVEEYESLNKMLDNLWTRFLAMHCNPALIPVPGNHDLVRPDQKRPSAVLRVLNRWENHEDAHEEFWSDEKSDYRTLVRRAFSNYEDWFASCPHIPHTEIVKGLLPGDISYTHIKDDVRFGILGLNSSILHLGGRGSHQGHLIIDYRQASASCEGDLDAWSKAHAANILMTHHPADWLDQESASQFYDIARPGRFLAHLHGHLHESKTVQIAISGSASQRTIQGRSLFGLDQYDDAPKTGKRSHGYNSACVTVDTQNATIVQWPRVATYRYQRGWSIGQDSGEYMLEENGQTRPESVALNTTPSNLPVRVGETRPALLSNQEQKTETKKRAYLDCLLRNFGKIRFVEMPMKWEMSDVKIEDLYVKPRFSRTEILVDTPSEHWPPTIDFESCLLQSGNLVLLGDPGSGKSTLIDFVTWSLAGAGRGLRTACPPPLQGRVPIPMILRELKLEADLTWEKLLDSFLEHRLGKELDGECLAVLLQKEGTVFLLDGLDEVGSIVVRKRLREAVHAGVSALPNSRWILTSRVVGYEDAPFHRKEIERRKNTTRSRGSMSTSPVIASLFCLAPLADEQIEEFSRSWYAQHESQQDAVTGNAKDFVAAISANDGTKRLARIPYLLTLMALVHQKDATLPHGRTGLYERIASAYLDQIDLRRKLNNLPYSVAQKLKWLSYVAYQMQRRRSARTGKGKGSLLFPRSQVERWLTEAISETGEEDASSDASLLVDYFAKRSGLLLPRGENRFSFMHLSLQEYFAACYIAPRLTQPRFTTSGVIDPSDDDLRSWANDIVWTETFVLLFEQLSQHPRAVSEGTLRHLFHDRFGRDTQCSQVAAAQLLSEIVVDRYTTIDAATRRKIRNELWLWDFRYMELVTRRVDREMYGPRDHTGPRHQLVAEYSGNLSNAWSAAGLSESDLGDVKSLRLDNILETSDLTFLRSVRSLEHLSLVHCVGIVDLSPLADLPHLRYLSVAYCEGIRDLSPLGEVSSLESLSLAGNERISNLEGLSQLPNLRVLDLGLCTQVKDFGSLLKLPLRKLRVVHSGLEDLAFLGELGHLRDLTISVRRGVDVPKLNSLEHLHAVHAVADSGVCVNLSFLENCRSLKTLVVTQAKALGGTSALATCASLEDVHFHECGGAIDLMSLESLRKLKLICFAGAKQKTSITIPRKLKNMLSEPMRPTVREVPRKATPRKASKATPRKASKATPRKASKATPRKASKATPRKASKATPRKASKATPRKASK